MGSVKDELVGNALQNLAKATVSWEGLGRVGTLRAPVGRAKEPQEATFTALSGKKKDAKSRAEKFDSSKTSKGDCDKGSASEKEGGELATPKD
jgi:hypothetical protein